MPSTEVGAEVLQKPRLELLAVGAVVDPFARRGDPLAGGDRRGVADHGDEIAMAARLDPQNAEAVLGIVERHPLDQAGEHLLGRCFRLRLHAEMLRSPVSARATPSNGRAGGRQMNCWVSAQRRRGTPRPTVCNGQRDRPKRKPPPYSDIELDVGFALLLAGASIVEKLDFSRRSQFK